MFKDIPLNFIFIIFLKKIAGKILILLTKNLLFLTSNEPMLIFKLFLKTAILLILLLKDLHFTLKPFLINFFANKVFIFLRSVERHSKSISLNNHLDT